MERELAYHVAMVAFRSSANLNELVPLLRAFCDESEYKIFLESITAVSADISYNILKKIYDEHPGIEQDFEDRIEKYGFLISG